MTDWAALLPDPPSEVQIRIEVLQPQGDPEAWALEFVRRHTEGGGWVQLTDRVLARSADDIGWSDARGRPAELDGFVESAEGIDRDGHSWRLRWSGGDVRAWRVLEGEGEPCLAFTRTYASTWGRAAPRICVREYWAIKSEPNLEASGGQGACWQPHIATFRGWSGEQDV